MLSTSIEDYIKAIHGLQVEDQKATTKRIADRLGVRMASVTGMVKHLAAEGYVRHTPYYGVKLSEKGRRVAVAMIRRHRVLELFLCETLGLRWDEVDADAEVLEHAVSDRLIERIYEFLGRPASDPHGSPIPRRNGPLPPQAGILLSELSDGDRGCVVEVSDRDPAFLRTLTKLKLEIGTKFVVRENSPAGGPIKVDIGTKRASIARDAAKRIRVSRQTAPSQRKAGPRRKRS